ncbi:MAG: Uma2 family endonuclease [Leptolyngbyaceae cyanobacterium SM1_3_5]|nr:Uma2 family endonuclease [Leptolyngbyaceae cyanobacterium SM1_3_5]
MQATQVQHYTPEEYLKLEEAADFKSEYRNGKIIPNISNSINHNRILGNFAAAAHFALNQYEVFIANLRLWIPKKRIFTYPHAMIVAGEPKCYSDRTDTITNPQVIIEVLSASTEDYDRQGKYRAYRSISTFQEYLLIDQSCISVEHYSKTGKKKWSMQEYDEEDEAIEFTSVPFQISLADLYQKVKFEAIEQQ